jgi:hypothetical protein
MIDTLLILALLGLAVPLLYVFILKIFGSSRSAGRLEEFGEIVKFTMPQVREAWTQGDPSYREAPPEEVECQYCGTLYPRDFSKCPNCYAPRKNNR